jgi:hypothetical protein
LLNERKALGLQACQQFIQSVDDDFSVLGSILTASETWCFQYDPATKRQLMEWRSPNCQRLKQFRFQKSKNRVMLVTFFDGQRNFNKESVPLGQAVNKEFCVEVKSRLVQRICPVRPQFQE